MITLFGSTVQAQISKGKIVVGLNLSYYRQNYSSGNTETHSMGTTITPSIAFATRENRTSGFFLSYGHSTQTPEQKANNYGAGVFTRRYKQLGSRFYLFGQATVGASYFKSTNSYSTVTNLAKLRSAAISVAPGLSFAFSKRMHLEVSTANLLSLSYNFNTFETVAAGTSNKSTSKGFGLYANLQPASNLAVGFRLLFGK